jgi:hypothetical protein
MMAAYLLLVGWDVASNTSLTYIANTRDAKSTGRNPVMLHWMFLTTEKSTPADILGAQIGPLRKLFDPSLRNVCFHSRITISTGFKIFFI